VEDVDGRAGTPFAHFSVPFITARCRHFHFFKFVKTVICSSAERITVGQMTAGNRGMLHSSLGYNFISQPTTFRFKETKNQYNVVDTVNLMYNQRR
jgi:hypothetical protein